MAVYLVCTSKPAFVVFWAFWVNVESITYLFSEPSGGSIPSLAIRIWRFKERSSHRLVVVVSRVSYHLRIADPSSRDFPEARLWPTSGWPTIRTLARSQAAAFYRHLAP